MAINIQDDILKLHALGLLDKLLIDRTTKKNILWATNTYSELGTGYGREEEITSDLITGKNASTIKTRAQKAMEQQSERTRQHAEVFSPFWVCREMTNYADEIWSETGTDWKKYVNSRQMEITCGEAPYLVSRYDVETGEAVPISERIGLLDRKLKAVNDHAQSEEEWLKWSIRAYKATYGYDYQGDNVLISRVNLLMTFEDYLWERWKRTPTIAEYKKLIAVVTWNLWQMDGLTGAVPCGSTEDEQCQISLFDLLGETTESMVKISQSRCLIHNWASGSSVEFLALSTGGKQAMKFDFIVGNPPYQEENTSNNRQAPIYNLFMDEVYKIATVVELITPARFLFEAGQTPKAWNKKMLSDPHLKVVMYEPNSSAVFSNTDIKGGVAITLRNTLKDYGAIGVFVDKPILQSIVNKVGAIARGFLSELAHSKSSYNLMRDLYFDFPALKLRLTTGNEYIIDANIFKKMPEAFSETISPETIKVYGREDGKRICKWIGRKYIRECAGLSKYKVFVTGANGRGELGETLSSPFVGEPYSIGTQTYMSFGWFDTQAEADACLKYIKTKFARCLLGVLKKTQNNPREVWSKIPLQDFSTIDIDWTKSIPEIDQQLYAKYGLDKAEIEFIETHVKEME